MNNNSIQFYNSLNRTSNQESFRKNLNHDLDDTLEDDDDEANESKPFLSHSHSNKYQDGDSLTDVTYMSEFSPDSPFYSPSTSRTSSSNFYLALSSASLSMDSSSQMHSIIQNECDGSPKVNRRRPIVSNLLKDIFKLESAIKEPE